MDKLEVGDKVEIVEYGQIEWANDESEVFTRDIMPDLVGQKGTITAKNSLGKFAVNGIIGKYAWYNKDQLKKL